MINIVETEEYAHLLAKNYQHLVNEYIGSINYQIRYEHSSEEEKKRIYEHASSIADLESFVKSSIFSFKIPIRCLIKVLCEIIKRLKRDKDVAYENDNSHNRLDCYSPGAEFETVFQQNEATESYYQERFQSCNN